MHPQIDKKRFFPVVCIIAAVLILVSVSLESVQAAVEGTDAFFSKQFDWLFVASNLAAFIFSLWIAFGPYAKVKLGGEDAKPEYSKFSWIAMMFTTSCSAGLIVFGFIETTIYSSTAVPFHAEPFSIEAYEYAAMYTHYHWGLNAWSLYVPASVAVGYMLYNRRQSQISMSSACSPLLKSGCNRLSGCLIDIFGTFGAIAAPVTSMGLGMPLLTLLLAALQYTVFRPEDLLALLSRIMPDEVLPLFSDFLQKAYQKSGAAIISLSALTAAWSASRGIYGISKGLSAVLDVPETRSYLRLRLLCLFYMLLFVLGLVLTLLFHVFGQRLLALLTRKGLPLAGILSFLLEHLQLYSFLLLTALFSLLYLALPDRRQRLSAVFPGALAAAGAWLLFSALFSVYVNHFAKGLALYGSLTTMVLTMLWVYACVSIVFYGAFLNRLLLRLRTGA